MLRKTYNMVKIDDKVDPKVCKGSLKKTSIFSDIVQKGGRGLGLNHYIRPQEIVTYLGGWVVLEVSMSLFDMSL